MSANPPSKIHHLKSAFTLVELLVVITIIGILISLLLPAVQAAREAARRAQCLNNLRQVALAMHNHDNAFGTLPPGAADATPYWGQGTWQVSILPYIEQQALRDIYYDYGVNNGRNYFHDDNLHGAVGRQIAMLLCPSDTVNKNGWPGAAINCTYHNYAVNFGNTAVDQSADWQVKSYNGLTFRGAPFTRGRPLPLSRITDGTSNTLLAAELIQGQGHDLRGLTWWGPGAGFETSLRPNDSSPDITWSDSSWCNSDGGNPPCGYMTSGANVFAARSRHPGGVNAALCDGSTRFVNDSITATVWQALGTTKGGEVVSDF